MMFRKQPLVVSYPLMCVQLTICVACYLIWPVVFVRTCFPLGYGDQCNVAAQNG